MTRHDPDRLKNLFTAGAGDVTPASAHHAARVLYLPVSGDPEVSSLCASVLSDAERQRAGRIAANGDRARFEQRRAFRLFCAATALESARPLSEIRFETTENGRPYLADAPDLWFSFSCYRRGMLGAWSSTHGIGVDIEDQRRKVEAEQLARRYFSVTEAEVVESVDGADRLQTFFRFWTLKEAALKSIGEGLPFGLDAFEFELKPQLRVVHALSQHGGSENFEAHEVVGLDSCAALVIRGLA